MVGRYLTIWFRHLMADHLIRRQPILKGAAFVFAASERGRKIVKATSAAAQAMGIRPGMVVADCRAIQPDLQIFDDDPAMPLRLLEALAEWSLRYTPVAAVDLPGGLVLDISGCAHLWGGEYGYLKDILQRLEGFGYHISAAIADTIGTAWAVSRFGLSGTIIESGRQIDALLPLPPVALRLEPPVLARLEKLGLYQIRSFMYMPRTALRRRFGEAMLNRLDQATGQAIEALEPIAPVPPYQERLPCLEPIRTATGIGIALEELLGKLCLRLSREGKGLKKGVLKAHRIDGNIQQIVIGTNRATFNAGHLFRLFELKVATMEPALGFELFILEAALVEDVPAEQEALWSTSGCGDEVAVAELLDRIAGKVGLEAIHRYLPAEHHWPERSMKPASSLQEKPVTDWRTDLRRPLHLLPRPEPIEVSVPLPDYPPMLFRHKGVLHKVSKADGPERIEQEWWLEQGLHRDYYCVEDDKGIRYWLFRSGHYNDDDTRWFLHGFFA